MAEHDVIAVIRERRVRVDVGDGSVRRCRNGISRLSMRIALQAFNIQTLVHLPAFRAHTTKAAARPGLSHRPDEKFVLLPALKNGVVGRGQIERLSRSAPPAAESKTPGGVQQTAPGPVPHGGSGSFRLVRLRSFLMALVNPSTSFSASSREVSGEKVSTPSLMRLVMSGAASQRKSSNSAKTAMCRPLLATVYCSSSQAPWRLNCTRSANPPMPSSSRLA